MTGKLSGRVFLFLLCGVVGIAGCKTRELTTVWSDSIHIDGFSDDWNDASRHYFPEEQVVLGLASDSENVYLLLRFRDPRQAMTLRRSGLTIALDPSGGKDQIFRLTYRGGPSAEELASLIGSKGRDASGSHARGLPEGELARAINMRPEFTCFIKDHIVEMGIPTDGSLGPIVAYANDQGFFCYEFSIPLRESQVRNYGLGAPLGSEVGLFFGWGDDARPARETMGGRSGGGKRGGGGRSGGGGGKMGGGRAPGGGGNRQVPPRQEVWVKTRLAEPAAAHPESAFEE